MSTAIATEPSLRMSPTRPGFDRALAALLIISGVVLFATMPKYPYRGDPLAVRAASAHLLTTGELGIPIARKADLADLGVVDGQYFFTNAERGKLFSKYGIGNTLLFLPPLAAERAYRGTVDCLDLEFRVLTVLFPFQFEDPKFQNGISKKFFRKK